MPPPPPSIPPGYQAYSHTGPSTNYAGFGGRFGAYLLDGLIAIPFLLPAFIALFAGPSEIKACTVDGVRGLCDTPTGSTIALAIALYAVGGIGYLYLYCRKVGAGQSWGQQAAGIRVVDATTGQPIGTGRAVGRFFARLLSGAVCYLGFFWMLWDQRKQTWHDKMVSSVVVKE